MTKVHTYVRKMQTKDVSQILAIQTEHDITKKDVKKQLEEGFLVHLMSKKEIHSFTLLSDRFLMVYDKNKTIQGYLSVYDGEAWCAQDAEWSDIQLDLPVYNSFFQDCWIYCRHIATRISAPQNTAFSLEHATFEEAVARGYHCAVGEICLNPFNKRSYDFNTRCIGWKKIGSLQRSDGFLWGVFGKNLT